jgi:septal ring factor EnvC (AmiA/AmiB activator)
MKKTIQLQTDLHKALNLTLVLQGENNKLQSDLQDFQTVIKQQEEMIEKLTGRLLVLEREKDEQRNRISEVIQLLA